jgi:hypothetical protein
MNKFVITQEVIDTLVDAEMQSVKGMKKKHLFQLVRELFEERVREMSNEGI